MIKGAQKRPITAACLDAGNGIFCAGLQLAGVNTIWANEKSGGAVETFDTYHPGVKLLNKGIADLSVIGDNLAPVDILTAGLPRRNVVRVICDDDFDEKHARFFADVVRLAGEFGDKRPPIVLLESIPCLMTDKYFGQFMRILNDLRFAGYWFCEGNCRIVKTKTGKRLFMVAASTSGFYCNDFIFPRQNNRQVPLHTTIGDLAMSCVRLLQSDSRCKDALAA